MLSPSQIAYQLHARKRRARVVFSAVIVLIFAALLGARPAWHWWREQRAAKNLRLGREAIEAQNWSMAMALIGQALHDAPSDAEVLRAVAEVQRGTGDSPMSVVQTLQRLIELNKAVPADYLALAKAQLDRGDLLAVQVALNSVPTGARSSPLAVEVESELLIRLERLPEAESRLREALKINPDDTDAALKGAAINLKKSDPKREGDARNLLWNLARAKDGRSLVAMNVLLHDPKLSAPFAAELVTLAEAQCTPASTSVRYAALGAVLRLIPSEREQRLDRETERSLKSDTSAQLAFLRFLAAEQEPQRMLSYLFEHGALLRQKHASDVLNLKLEALAQTHQWPQVRELLAASPPKALDVVTLHLWNACASAALDPNETAARKHLNAAFEVTNLITASRVADTAERLSYYDLAAELYEKLARSAPLPGDRIEFLEKAFGAKTKLRDTAALVRIAEQITTLTPGHPGNAFRADYLALLTKAALDTIVIRLNNAVSGDTETAAHQRLLWAMIYHQRNQLDSLRKELAGLEDLAAWPPGQRAVLAALIASTGEIQRAFKLAEKIPPQQLLPEERQLLKQVRGEI